MIAYFNEPITFKIYALKSDDGITERDLPAAPIRLSLFENYPTKDQVVSGSGALRNLGTTWSNTEDLFGKQFEIDPIENQDPQAELTYYVGISVKLESTNTNPIVIVRELILSPIKTQESRLHLTIRDCLAVAPTLKSFFANSDIQTFCYGDLNENIFAAIEDVKSSFSTKQIDYAMISKPSLLKLAATHLAISFFYFGESRSVSDVYYSHGIRHAEIYKQKVKALNLPLDTNRDGAVDQHRSKGVKFIRLTR